MDRRGFTLLEMLFVIALAGIFVGATFPLAQSYLRRGKLDAVAREFASAARHAQALSRAGQNDAAWGIKVSTGAITLFQGATYATRTSSYDQVTSIPAGDVISGTAEYDFVKGTGRTTSGTLTVTDSGGTAKSISVNGFGTVDF